MLPYYLTIILVFFATVGAARMDDRYAEVRTLHMHKKPPLTRFFLVLAILILTSVAGLRYYVGADYVSYYRGFAGYARRFASSIRSLDEPGLPLLATVISWFTNDGVVFIFACAAITMMLQMVTIYNNTSSYVFVTLLMIFAGNWHGSFNGVRQFLAAAIAFAGYQLIMDKKFWKYALVVFVAFCVHKSAIIMILPYYIFNRKISVWNILLLVLVTALLASNYERVFSLVGFLKKEEMSITDSGYYSKSVNILRVLVACAPALLAVLLNINKKPSGEQTFYINALIFNATAMVATANSAYLARLGIYSNMLVPLALTKILDVQDPKMERILKVVIILLFAIYWYIEVSGSSTMSEYQWVLSR